MKNNMGRIIGYILLVGGLAVGAIVVGLMMSYRSEGSLSAGAAFLGMAFGLVVLVLPQLGFGAFMVWRGGQDAAVAAKAGAQRQLLDIVKSRAQVPISDLVIEMGSTRDEVHQMVHQLVGMGLFSGYVNWDEGTLYSEQASALRELSRCMHCDGELELAGKGVIRCPFCSTEYFL